jgi:hypothetical protein
MMRLILCCLIAIAFTGCGLSARQAQNLSDGLAGIEAAQPRVADPVASAALAGAHDHVEATAEGESLPPPKLTPAAIIADPASYADDASKAVDEARSMVPWWGWALGALGAALGVVRMIPGPGGALADLAWQALAPKATRQADTIQATHAMGFQSLVRLIEQLPNTATISTLKGQVTTKFPSMVRDAIPTVLNELR